MAATAIAQRQARSRAPSSRPAPRRDRPRRDLRVVRTAAAISDAADSRLIVRLTRSQAWIGIVGVLLIGIVALNVYSLGMSSVVSSTAERALELERQNSLLRERIGKIRQNGQIERSAAKLGLGQPTSEELVRVSARKGDAAAAAARLKGQATPVAAPAVAAPVAEAAIAEPVPTEAAAPEPVDAVAADPAAAAAEEPPPIDPVASAGGVAP